MYWGCIIIINIIKVEVLGEFQNNRQGSEVTEQDRSLDEMV